MSLVIRVGLAGNRHTTFPARHTHTSETYTHGDGTDLVLTPAGADGDGLSRLALKCVATAAVEGAVGVQVLVAQNLGEASDTLGGGYTGGWGGWGGS
jgi:hypothetical protein